MLVFIVSTHAAFTQDKSAIDIDTKVEQLQDRLKELKAVDMNVLSKEEKKLVRKEKRTIRGELYNIREMEERARLARWGYWDPYLGFYNPAFAYAYGHPAFGFSRFRRFYYRPRVIVVRTRT